MSFQLKLGISYIFDLLLILLMIQTIINSFRSRNNDENQQTLSALVFSVVIVSSYIFSEHIFFFSLENETGTNYFGGFSYFIYSIISLFLLYPGVITALIYKKTKKVSFLVMGIILCFISIVGFGLGLFKALQMFSVIA